MFAFVDTAHTDAGAVVDASDGRWTTVEVRQGGPQQLAQAARSLQAVQSTAVESKAVEAAKLMVTTVADNYAHERPDGVCVVLLHVSGP